MIAAGRQPSPRRATSGRDDASVSGDIASHAGKRKADDEGDVDDVVDVKRRSAADFRPPTGAVQGLRIPDVNGFVTAGAAQVPCRSVFQHVNKTTLGPTTPPSPSLAISSSSPSDVASFASLLPPLSVVTSTALAHLSTTSTAPYAGTTTSGLLLFPAQRLRSPLVLGTGFVASNNQAPETFYPMVCDESAYARKFVANNNNSMIGNDVNLFSQSSLGIAVDQSRHARLPSPPNSVRGGHRTSNPMVDKLLQIVSSARPAASSSKSSNGVCGSAALSASFPSLQLAQNWCAKCNTSFRMTSDLVYHMRTHHKRDLDPTNQGRRKNDHKLRCDVCGETFKERHHLTRHMTSHT